MCLYVLLRRNKFHCYVYSTSVDILLKSETKKYRQKNGKKINKSKAVPLHAMEALGGRGGIAPTHSRPRH
jgi:hypothetical protein